MLIGILCEVVSAVAAVWGLAAAWCFGVVGLFRALRAQGL